MTAMIPPASPVETEATPLGQAMAFRRLVVDLEAHAQRYQRISYEDVAVADIAAQSDRTVTVREAVFAEFDSLSAEARSLREALAAAHEAHAEDWKLIDQLSARKCELTFALGESESSARSLREERIAADERFRALKHAAIVFWGHPPFPLEDPKARALEDALAASLSPSPAS